MKTFSTTQYNFEDPEILSIIDELPFWSAPFGIKLLDVIPVKKNMTVLDIGSGLGFPVIEIASRLGQTCKVYGIDPWNAALKKAQKKIDIFNMKNIELIEGAAENIPLPDSSCDLITSNNGLNNVQDLDKVFSEINRISKPGAFFAATINLDGTMKEFYDVFEQVLADNNLSDVIPSVRQHIYKKRRPVAEYKELLLKNNFVNFTETYESFRYRYADGTTMFSNPFIQYAFLDSWLELVPSDKQDIIFTEIENRINTISEKQGEWILTIPFVVMTAQKF